MKNYEAVMLCKGSKGLRQASKDEGLRMGGRDYWVDEVKEILG